MKSSWRVAVISGSALPGAAANAGTDGRRLQAGTGARCAGASTLLDPPLGSLFASSWTEGQGAFECSARRFFRRHRSSDSARALRNAGSVLQRSFAFRRCFSR